MSSRFLAPLIACSAMLALSAAPAAAAQGVAVPAAVAAQTARYVFTDLGVLGGLDSQARALSGRGQVVGLADTCPGCGPSSYHAFSWTPTTPNGTAGSMIDLGTLRGHGSSVAEGVNDSGLVAGWSGDAFISRSTRITTARPDLRHELPWTAGRPGFRGPLALLGRVTLVLP